MIGWLEANGLARKNIIIWDRFDFMLKDAGFTAERLPRRGIEGLQTMDEAAAEGKTQDNSKWLRPGRLSYQRAQFRSGGLLLGRCRGPQGPALSQPARLQRKHSYFGKLLTKKLTKIVNLPAFKNTGNAISYGHQRTSAMARSAIRTGSMHRCSWMSASKSRPSGRCATRWS